MVPCKRPMPQWWDLYRSPGEISVPLFIPVSSMKNINIVDTHHSLFIWSSGPDLRRWRERVHHFSWNWPGMSKWRDLCEYCRRFHVRYANGRNPNVPNLAYFSQMYMSAKLSWVSLLRKNECMWSREFSLVMWTFWDLRFCQSNWKSSKWR